MSVIIDITSVIWGITTYNVPIAHLAAGGRWRGYGTAASVPPKVVSNFHSDGEVIQYDSMTGSD